MKLLLYLLQVSACTGLFYLFYILILSRLTFFSLNRWYLLASLLLSFAIPLIKVSTGTIISTRVAESVHVPSDTGFSPDAVAAFADKPKQHGLASPSGITTVPPPDNNSADHSKLLLLSYLSIASFLALRLVLSILLLLVRLNAGHSEKVGKVRIVRNSRHPRNGSFFSYIFVSDKDLAPDELRQVIAHESVHVSQLHSVDKLVAGIAQAVLWFNPFAYAYTHAIDVNHEFEVDSSVCGHTGKKAYAELLLRLASPRSSVYHHFSRLPLKTRISMLYCKPSKSMKKAIYLLSLPLVAASLLAFAQRESVEAAPIVKPTAVNSTVAEPENTPEPQEGIRAHEEAAASAAPPVAAPTAPKKKPLPAADLRQTQRQGPSPLSDYSNVKKIRTGGTTLEEIQKQFGDPSRTEISREYRDWFYKQDYAELAVMFDSGNKVINFSYSLRNPGSSPVLSVSKVKSIRNNISNEGDIKKLFGEPSLVAISPSFMNMVYMFEDGHATGSRLELEFEKVSLHLVTNHSFSEWNFKDTYISPEQVGSIEQGQTTMAEIVKELGLPNMNVIDLRGETWTYLSPSTKLEILFGKEDINRVSSITFNYHVFPK